MGQSSPPQSLLPPNHQRDSTVHVVQDPLTIQGAERNLELSHVRGMKSGHGFLPLFGELVSTYAFVEPLMNVIQETISNFIMYQH